MNSRVREKKWTQGFQTVGMETKSVPLNKYGLSLNMVAYTHGNYPISRGLHRARTFVSLWAVIMSATLT